MSVFEPVQQAACGTSPSPDNPKFLNWKVRPGRAVALLLWRSDILWSLNRCLELQFTVDAWFSRTLHESSQHMRRAIYPGSFDPVTNGHLDIIARARKLFDEVVVAVAHNIKKEPLFTLEERLGLLRDALGSESGVRVGQFEGLLVDFAVSQQANAVIRGLRAVSDFEFEFQMALMNRKLQSAVETIFLMPKEEYTYLSSRLVKEIARLGGDISSFVPLSAATALRQKFSR
jgi:pantetheine-phosphate adenylyltransferase